MSADDEDVDTTRKTVKTFVPAYQKTEWKRHADDLDMSQSEFVRTMVQAGRRDFEVEPRRSGDAGSAPAPESNGNDAPDRDAPARADGERERGPDDGGGGSSPADLETHVVRALSEADHLSWDDLLDRVTGDIEDRLDETLQELQADDRVRYSGRHDGYVLAGGDDGD